MFAIYLQWFGQIKKPQTHTHTHMYYNMHTHTHACIDKVNDSMLTISKSLGKWRCTYHHMYIWKCYFIFRFDIFQNSWKKWVKIDLSIRK